MDTGGEAAGTLCLSFPDVILTRRLIKNRDNFVFTFHSVLKIPIFSENISFPLNSGSILDRFH
jgi:hypothetical protein